MTKINEIRIISPSASAQTFFSKPKYETRFQNAQKTLMNFCQALSFSPHAFEIDNDQSSAITSRIEDIHHAFADKNVEMIMCARGGYNSNQLLDSINWQIIRNNPKIFIGFSDITVLCNAIYQMTGTPTYLGYNFIDFGRENLAPQVLTNIKNIINGNKITLNTEEAIIINSGQTKGICIGGNLSSFMLLKGTKYMPEVDNAVLVLESDHYLAGDADKFFIRNLYSLLQDKSIKNIRGIIIGQFEEEDCLPPEYIKKLIKNIKELNDVPIVANLRFSHKYPSELIKIGAEITLCANDNHVTICFES